jgi:hypothetical protein
MPDELFYTDVGINKLYEIITHDNYTWLHKILVQYKRIGIKTDQPGQPINVANGSKVAVFSLLNRHNLKG